MEVPAGEVAPIEQIPVDRLGARQDARQGVVVARGDRVELVVVTAGATDRQAEDGLADRVELLVDHVDQQLLLIGRADHLGPDDQEPGRHDVLVPLLLGAKGEQVAGELLGTLRALAFGILRPGDEDDEPADIELVLDCPFCRHPVPFPGRGGEGCDLLAECDRCDVYFGSEPDEVYTASRGDRPGTVAPPVDEA
jgi:hypothetical protein